MDDFLGELKKRAAKFCTDNIKNPTQNDFLFVESAAMIGYLLCLEEEMHGSKKTET